MMDNSFLIVRQVCEHAQASGLIKTLKDAVVVSNAVSDVELRIQELLSLRIEVEKLRSERMNNDLMS